MQSMGRGSKVRVTTASSQGPVGAFCQSRCTDTVRPRDAESGWLTAFGEAAVSVACVIGDFAAKPVGRLEALAWFLRAELDLGKQEALELSAEFVKLDDRASVRDLVALLLDPAAFREPPKRIERFGADRDLSSPRSKPLPRLTVSTVASPRLRTSNYVSSLASGR
jgi:hypothetical protein